MSDLTKWIDWGVSLFTLLTFSVTSIIFLSKVIGKIDASAKLTIFALCLAFCIKFFTESYLNFSVLQYSAE